MNRLIASVIGGALLAGSVGLMIANAQQAPGPAFIAGDRPVTAEQVREKLQTDGWSNVVISRNGRYIEVSGSRNGEVGKMAVDLNRRVPEERRRLKPSPLDLSSTAVPEISRPRSILSVQRHRLLSCASRWPLMLPLPRCTCRRSSSLRFAQGEMKG